MYKSLIKQKGGGARIGHNSPAATAKASHGQKPPTPAEPVRQQSQLAGICGSFSVKAPK